MSAPVRALWERFEARDWAGAAEQLAEGAVVEWPHSGERLAGRDAVIEVNRRYPEPWSIELRRVVEGDGLVAAEVAVRHPRGVVFCTGFYEVADGRIERGTEYWLDPLTEEPPAWREGLTERYTPA